MVKRFFSFLTILMFFGLSPTFTQPLTAVVNDEALKSLRVYSTNKPFATGVPAITLGTDETIVIEFDLLEDDRRYLRYELIHCDFDWRPSRMTSAEIVDGFNEGRIEIVEYSRATTVPYVHYRIVIPDQQLFPKLSGNYAVRIYDEENPDETLATARFVVNEATALIGGGVTTRTDRDYNRTHQQLNLEIDMERTGAGDLFNEVIVVISQNGRNDNAHVLTKPMRVSGRTLIYEHLDPLIFPAGNEYRRFETVSNTLTGMGVDRIEYHAPYYNHYLVIDHPRNGSSYLYDETLGGGFVVREYNSDDSDVDADYVVVHFSLEMPELTGRDVFIDSDVFQRRFSPESRMVYNRGSGRYEKAVLMKQGAYSYQYLAVPTGSDKGLTSVVEGDKFQTNNTYTVNVYLRQPGERYDRLVGTTRITTGQPIY